MPSFRTFRTLGALVAAAAILAGASSSASAYTLSPMSQVFEPSGSGATQAFTLVNPGGERIAVELSMQTLGRDVDYVESNRPADDEFLVVPSQVLLAPGARQTVRVTWLGAPDPRRELAYRLVATQLPIDFSRRVAATAATGNVSILKSYRGTVFVRPRGAAPRVAVVAASPDQTGTQLELVMGNQGRAHGKLRACEVRLDPAGSGRATVLTGARLGDMDGSRVLAGSRRRYRMPWPAGLAVGPVRATVRCAVER